MKTNNQEKINITKDDIIAATLPVLKVAGLGLTSVVLKKLNVPSTLICSMINAVL